MQLLQHKCFCKIKKDKKNEQAILPHLFYVIVFPVPSFIIGCFFVDQNYVFDNLTPNLGIFDRYHAFDQFVPFVF